MESLADLPLSIQIIAAAAVGLVVGSFLNVVILRLPARLMHDWRCQCRELLGIDSATENGQAPPGLVASRSHCPKCSHAIAWYDNVPLASWLILRGRCRHCARPISARYPVVEAVTAVLSAIVVWQLGTGWDAAAGLILTWALIAATGIDIDHQLLPDQITLPLVWLGLLANAFGLYTDLHSAVIGAAAGYLSLWLVFHAFRLATGKEGMGFGDFKLFAAIGAWFGWQVLPSVILLASGVGALVGLALIALRRMGRDVPIAFGPFLAAAGWLALVLGERIERLWMLF